MSRETATPEYPFAVKAGVAAAALLALWGVLEFTSIEPEYQRQNSDLYKIAAQISRFEDFRAAVPENAVLGYMTDLAPGNASFEAMFNGAQYALAPRLLNKSTSQNLVLGNFTKQLDYTALGREQGLQIERDFGNGVVLFRKDVR